MFLFCSQLPGKSIGMSQGPKRYQYLRFWRLLAIARWLHFLPATIPQKLMDFAVRNVIPWERLGRICNVRFCSRFFSWSCRSRVLAFVRGVSDVRP